MATRSKSDEPAAGVSKKTAARKTAAPASAAKKKAAAGNRKVPVADTAEPDSNLAEALLRAGLKALDNVRHDVVKRQTHVIEGLLGVRVIEELKARAFPGFDPLGFRKFEDVFDQRVATSLARLGVPSAQEVEALREEVRALREQLALLAHDQQQRTRTTTKR